MTRRHPPDRESERSVGSRLGNGYDGGAIVGDGNPGRLYALPLDASRRAFALGGFTGVADLVADGTAEGALEA